MILTCACCRTTMAGWFLGGAPPAAARKRREKREREIVAAEAHTGIQAPKTMRESRKMKTKNKGVEENAKGGSKRKNDSRKCAAAREVLLYFTHGILCITNHFDFSYRLKRRKTIVTCAGAMAWMQGFPSLSSSHTRSISKSTFCLAITVANDSSGGSSMARSVGCTPSMKPNGISAAMNRT